MGKWMKKCLFFETRSLLGELVRLLFVSGLVAGITFFLLCILLNQGKDRYFAASSYLEKAEQKMVQDLQDYVLENKVLATDQNTISAWVKKKSIIYLEIYRNDRLLFVPDSTEEKDFYENIEIPYYRESYYVVSFADGEAEVFLMGAFAYHYQVYALVVELLVGFLIFMFCFIRGVRKRIFYIQNLRQEVKIMEGGYLEHPVLVMGKDELAELAEGLDQLRCSLKENIEREQELKQANQNLVIGMAHDLRTPLTALTMYVQVMQSEVCIDEKKRSYYLEKIMAKAVQIKELSDWLFICSQIGEGSDENKQDEVMLFQSVFMDNLSEMAVFLESQGFCLEADLEWKKEYIRVRMDYIARIIDNLGMNLVKYADPNVPVRLFSIHEKDYAGIAIVNQIKKKDKNDPPQESTKIGMGNVRAMMKSMNGHCEEEYKEGRYKICILFPCVTQHIS